MPEKVEAKMPEIPDLTDVEIVFGSVKHLPSMESIPDEFKMNDRNNPFCKLTTDWFFKGLDKEQISSMVPKEGVDKLKAVRALSAILKSFEPQHEHKEAGVAYLMSCWFDVKK
jgi:hypothetical protein